MSVFLLFANESQKTKKSEPNGFTYGQRNKQHQNVMLVNTFLLHSFVFGFTSITMATPFISALLTYSYS